MQNLPSRCRNMICLPHKNLGVSQNLVEHAKKQLLYAEFSLIDSELDGRTFALDEERDLCRKLERIVELLELRKANQSRLAGDDREFLLKNLELIRPVNSPKYRGDRYLVPGHLSIERIINKIILASDQANHDS